MSDPAGVGGEQSSSLVSPAQGQTGLCKGLLLVHEMATRDKPRQGAAPRRGMEASHYAPFGVSQNENNEKETRTNRQPSGRGPPGHPKWSEEGLWVEGRGLGAQLTGHPARRTACAACQEMEPVSGGRRLSPSCSQGGRPPPTRRLTGTGAAPTSLRGSAPGWRGMWRTGSWRWKPWWPPQRRAGCRAGGRAGLRGGGSGRLRLHLHPRAPRHCPFPGSLRANGLDFPLPLPMAHLSLLGAASPHPALPSLTAPATQAPQHATPGTASP